MITSLPSDAREFLQYVISAVDANPDLREPLLRALLTDELLDMPVRLGRVEDSVKALEDDVGWLHGKAYETDVSCTATSLLNREFGFRRARVVLGNVIAMPRYVEDFHEKVAAAADDGSITDEQFQRIFATDVIVHCRRSQDAEPTWVAMEVNARVDADDIHRAQRSAVALQAVFGEEALPLVVGERIDPPYATLARESGVTCINLTE